jgi:hypothetical protein
VRARTQEVVGISRGIQLHTRNIAFGKLNAMI